LPLLLLSNRHVEAHHPPLQLPNTLHLVLEEADLCQTALLDIDDQGDGVALRDPYLYIQHTHETPEQERTRQRGVAELKLLVVLELIQAGDVVALARDDLLTSSSRFDLHHD
jgi:hypothetical protein